MLDIDSPRLLITYLRQNGHIPPGRTPVRTLPGGV